MSNEKSISVPGGLNAINLGRHWAAIDAGDEVIALISMSVPNRIKGDVFDAYAEHSKAALSVLGDVKSGEVIYDESMGYVFKKNVTHKGRSKNLREPKLYPLNFIG
jgi:hypothetical protein